MTLTLEDVKTRLGAAAGDWPDARISEVLKAERAAQRSRVDAPSPRPAELDDALLARVEHNLRTTDPDRDVVRVGVDAPGVRALEEPHNRRVPREQRAPDVRPGEVGEQPAPPISSSIAVLEAYVGDNSRRAAAILAAETDRARPRTSLVSHLEALVARDEDPDEDQVDATASPTTTAAATPATGTTATGSTPTA